MQRSTFAVMSILAIAAGCQPANPKGVASNSAGPAQPTNHWMANAPKGSPGSAKIVAIAPPTLGDGTATTDDLYDKKITLPALPAPMDSATATKEAVNKGTARVQAAGNH
jgi:hypothetical protein